jgi:hypothetical protein
MQERRFIKGVTAWLPGLVFALLAIVVFLAVRTGFPGGGPPPPPGNPPVPPGSHGRVKTAAGVVLGFKYNPHLDVNAIQVMVAQAGLLTIDFRPHTAQTVMGLAAVNDSVEVAYMSHPNDEVVGYVLVRIKNARTGKESELNELPPPPDVPQNHSAEHFTIHDPSLILDQYGGIVAIRSQHLLFHFKPGLVDDILALIKNAHEIGLSAVWRDDQAGFVNVDHDKVYVVLSVTIDNKTFLVR